MIQRHTTARAVHASVLRAGRAQIASARRLIPALVPALVLALLAGLATPASAQVEHPDELTYPPLPPIDVPTPERVELDNGLVVMLIEDHELPTVQATALIHTGRRYEPAEKLGLARLTGEVLRTGGTEEMDAAALDDFLESRAATIESSIGETTGRVTMSSLSDDFPEVLRVFADVVRRPAFAADRLEVAKTGLRAQISRRNDDPQGIVFREIDRVVYGEDSPYARVPEYATLAAVEREDLQAWHETYYHPDRMILGLVGDFDSEETLALVREAFGDWPRGGAVETPDVWYEEEPSPGIYLADKTDVTQSNIAMGHLGLRRDHPDYYALRVLNEIFSGGGTSRLMSEVRTRRGLAYGVFGQVGAEWDHPGLTLVWTSTKIESTAEALEVLLEESRALRGDRPPTPREVEEAKNAILSSFVFDVDSRDEVLGQQLTLEYFGYPLDRVAKFRERIDAVTVDDVRRVAREHLHPDRFAIVVVGPSEQLASDLEPFGEVAELDVSIPPPPQERAEVTEESAGRAAALLERAVDAAGGAERLASLEALRSRSTTQMSGPMGQMELSATGLRVYPGKAREEVQTPMGQMVMVTTPDAAFMITPRGEAPMPPSRAEESRKGLWHEPVALLRAFVGRDQRDGFSAVAAGSAEVEGTPVERVEVEVEGTVTTLAIDPETGRVLALTYQGTGPQGSPGQVRSVYSDFREVEGLVYPFSTVSTFEGERMSAVTVESLEVNPEIPEDAFARPGDDPAQSTE